MPEFTGILTDQEARDFEDALRDYLPAASPAVLGLTVPAGRELALPASYADLPCRITPAAEELLSGAFAEAQKLRAGGNLLHELGKLSLHGRQLTGATGFHAWVEWFLSCEPVAVAAFYAEDSDTITIVSWAEVREDVLRAVAEYNQRMAGWDWTRENC